MRFDSKCNICGSRNLKTFASRSDGIPVLVCDACRHGIVAYFQDDIESIYGDSYFHHPGHPESGYASYSYMAEHGSAWAAALVNLLRNSGRVLDIGCADGYLLRKLGAAYDRFGIEPNVSMSGKATADGIQMLGDDLLNRELRHTYAGTFDIVLAIAVFEHLADFRTGVEAALEMTAPEGLLIFEVPVLAHSDPADPWLRTSLEHIHYPSPESLDHLFRVILRTQLVGTVQEIQRYANTYVGVVAKSQTLMARLRPGLETALKGPTSGLSGKAARFRWMFDFLHAGKTTPDVLDLWSGISHEDLNPMACSRVSDIWKTDREQIRSLKVHVEQLSGAVAWHAEELRKRDQIIAMLHSPKSWAKGK